MDGPWFREMSPEEVAEADRLLREEEANTVEPPRCGPCSRGELNGPDGKPRKLLLGIEEGQAVIGCPEPECSGPDLDDRYADYWREVIGTVEPVPITLELDAPAPGHTHWDQIGCDCDWYLNIAPYGEEPS